MACSMRMSSHHARSVGAFAIALATVVGFIVPGVVIDPTPMLAAPAPVYAVLLGMVGVPLGLWSAHTIVTLRLPTQLAARRGSWALYIGLPALLCFDLLTAGKRLAEALSFRSGGTREHLIVLVVAKEANVTRLGRASHFVSIASPIDQAAVRLQVSSTVHDRIEPNADCVMLLTERASNGAVRIVRPVEWRAQCPWIS